MKRIRITTPENIEVEYALADIGSRTAAALIDSMIQGVGMLLIGIAILLIRNYSSQFWSDYYGWIIGISILLCAVIIYGYYIGMELSMNGKTLGKKVLKIRTIRGNGQPLTLKHSAIRNLFRVFIDMFGVGVVLIFFSNQRKRLGDMAASTIVVIEENKTRPVTLESLESTNENFRYYISKEEFELLRDYIERKNTMEDYSELREEMKLHFTKKFETLEILEDWKKFIDQL
jgi:uncharacterized RDD family membrane protein YckC